MNELVIEATTPLSKSIVIKDGKNIWSALNQFEVLAQLRVNERTDSLLISNLHTFMTSSIVGNDIVITWIMTGQQTRDLLGLKWGNNKTGYLTIIISDVGTTDQNAVVIPTFKVIGKQITTLGLGVL